MDFRNCLSTIDNFCQQTYDSFGSILAEFKKGRAEARKSDIEAWGKLDSEDQYPYPDGEEQKVAYEEYPALEANDLIGCFALVYIASSLEIFLDHLLRDAGLKLPNKKNKKQKRKSRGAEGGKVISTIHVLETAIGKNLRTDAVQLVKDIIAARNDFVHNNGYKREAKNSFFNEHDCRIVFNKANLGGTLNKLGKLSDFFEAECKVISKGPAKPKVA